MSLLDVKFSVGIRIPKVSSMVESTSCGRRWHIRWEILFFRNSDKEARHLRPGTGVHLAGDLAGDLAGGLPRSEIPS